MKQPTSADDWAESYAALRARGPAAASAWLGIPIVIAALVGMLAAAPLPAVLTASAPGLNAGTLLLMAAFVYYCVLSIRLAAGILPLLILTALPSFWLVARDLSLWPIASAVFAPAFCWQLLETRLATGRLQILRNLQYLMLGPVWLVRAAFRHLKLEY